MVEILLASHNEVPGLVLSCLQAESCRPPCHCGPGEDRAPCREVGSAVPTLRLERLATSASPRARTIRTPTHDAAGPRPPLHMRAAGDSGGTRRPRRRARRRSSPAGHCAGRFEHLSSVISTVAHVAAGMGVPWLASNDADLTDGKRPLVDDSLCFDRSWMIDIDDFVKSYPQLSGNCVTLFIDLTPVSEVSMLA